MSSDFDPRYEQPIAVRPSVQDELLDAYSELGKLPWEERYERIIEDFPSVVDERWVDRFGSDVDLLGRVIRDILKLEQAVPGRPGPRPALDVDDAQRRLAQLRGDDYTLLPFPDAITQLKGDLSYRQFAEKVSLDKSVVHRLCTGKIDTDAYWCRMVAYGCGKHPSYFVEWRIIYIVGAIVRRLEWSPESTIAIFEKLDRQAKRQRSVLA